MDYRTEAAIMAALERLMSGRTTFIIAHRLSTLAKATTIIAIQNGRVSETGSHGELMARRGLYYELQRAATRSADSAHADLARTLEAG